MERSRLSNSSLSSPFKKHNIDRLEQDKQYIIRTIHYLFVFYASKASRYAYKEINQKSFMELMSEVFQMKGVKLIKNSDLWKKIVTVYHGKGKNTSMEYQQFLKCLPAISEYFSKSQKTEDELKNLLKHLMIVYEKKVAKELEQKYVHFDNSFTRQTTDYLQKLNNNLYTLYKIYFPEEITNQSSHFDQPEEKIFQQVCLFFKEFQIFPKIISGSQLYLIFQEIISAPTDNPFTWMDSRYKLKDRVYSFGFSKYLELLVRIGVVSINRLREVEDPEWWASHQKECLKSLFQYMESVKTKSKNSRFQHVRFTLIVYEEYKSEREKWLTLSIDQQMKPSSNKGDFFDLFEKMKL